MVNPLDRDCNTCIHHRQGEPLDPICWNCLDTMRVTGEVLPRWELDWAPRRGTRKELEEDSQKLREQVKREAKVWARRDYMSSLSDNEIRYGLQPKQSRTTSLLEASLNTASGFILSYLVWMLVAAPLLDIPVNHHDTFWITVLFTGVSLVRSYVWRRLFNNNFGRVTV
jgi:hypothetical protein